MSVRVRIRILSGESTPLIRHPDASEPSSCVHSRAAMRHRGNSVRPVTRRFVTRCSVTFGNGLPVALRLAEVRDARRGLLTVLLSCHTVCCGTASGHFQATLPVLKPRGATKFAVKVHGGSKPPL
jgi:hypothetical protein